MLKIAIYGKGGIGKSTVTGNLAAAFAALGKRVIQIGCDPKADSTINLLGGEPLLPVMNYLRERDEDPETIQDISRVGFGGVLCIETGGPTPGLGCAGRGIIATFNLLEDLELFEKWQPDVVLYDVLGDVVCGGFSMPMRSGYADKVFVLTSGENMAIYAAGNIAMAVERFQGRGYASLGGFILNRRNVKQEEEKAAELAESFHSAVIGALDRSELVLEAEEQKQTVLEAFPDSSMAEQYRVLARRMLELCPREESPC
jgi:nitrogenase iron protein NifH